MPARDAAGAGLRAVTSQSSDRSGRGALRWLEVAFTAVISVSAVVIAFGAWRTPSTPAPPPEGLEILEEPRWREAVGGGQRVGAASAPVTIVVFLDYQCPACEAFEASLSAITDKYDDRVAIEYRHYPLERPHPQALPAALASGCAALQGGFEPMHRELFSNRRSLGEISWRELASRASIQDLDRFDACMRDSLSLPSVTRDRALALRLEAPGTPTVLINQFRFSGSARVTTVDSLVRLALESK